MVCVGITIYWGKTISENSLGTCCRSAAVCVYPPCGLLQCKACCTLQQLSQEDPSDWFWNLPLLISSQGRSHCESLPGTAGAMASVSQQWCAPVLGWASKKVMTRNGWMGKQIWSWWGLVQQSLLSYAKSGVMGHRSGCMRISPIASFPNSFSPLHLHTGLHQDPESRWKHPTPNIIHPKLIPNKKCLRYFRVTTPKLAWFSNWETSSQQQAMIPTIQRTFVNPSTHPTLPGLMTLVASDHGNLHSMLSLELT